jgi:hypothetical protein
MALRVQVSAQFPEHRALITSTKKAALQLHRHAWPGMLLSYYDWSENGVIATARQIQSEYWSLNYYSLFIQLTCYLISAVWLDRTSLLYAGAEVTVKADDAFGELQHAKGSYYAKIAPSSASTEEGEDVLYTVAVYGHHLILDGTIMGGISRKRLRHRKWHTTATVAVTDEMRHDSITAGHLLQRQFDHWVQLLPREKFWAWGGHSDNATHFNSGAMMNFCSRKMDDFQFLKMCWIEFGCPGHGKGPWDGLGAVLKQQVRSELLLGA